MLREPTGRLALLASKAVEAGAVELEQTEFRARHRLPFEFYSVSGPVVLAVWDFRHHKASGWHQERTQKGIAQGSTEQSQ